MSYILDALRKSAAERERSMTPGLNTPAIGPAPEALAAVRHTKMAFYGAVVFALLLLSAIVWLLMTRPVPTPVTVLQQPAQTQVLALAPPQPTAPEPEPIPAIVPDTAPKATVSTKAKPPRTKETPTPAPLVVAAQPTANEPHIYAVSELPDNIRATLPQLAISGAVYAETPANRMLIVSGQIYRESDELTPGLQVEHIHPREAIFKYQGYRYRQSYP